MKSYTLWLWIDDLSNPVASATTIQDARKKAYKILKKSGYGAYIEILDDSQDDYSTVGVMSKFPIKGREITWKPRTNPKAIYAVSPNGDIKIIMK